MTEMKENEQIKSLIIYNSCKDASKIPYYIQSL
jgi:hypothetical protein